MVRNRHPRHIKRYRQIARTLARHGLGWFALQLNLGAFIPFHWGLLGHPKRREPYTQTEHLHMALEDLGTTFVKLGQILSTRPDLLSPEYIAEFSKLQDSVPPVPSPLVADIIRRELGSPPMDEFAFTLRNELDCTREGQNADRIRGNFKDDPRLRVPRIYWEYSTERVLTMEEISGIKVSDFHALKNAGLDRERIAENCTHIILTMTYDHGFFHADPIPEVSLFCREKLLRCSITVWSGCSMTRSRPRWYEFSCPEPGGRGPGRGRVPACRHYQKTCKKACF